MTEDENATPLDAEYSDAERRFWKALRSALDDKGLHSQYVVVFENLIPGIRQSAQNDHLSGTEYLLRLQEARSITDEIASALSADWADKKPGSIWCSPTLDCLNFRPDGRLEASPVDKRRLDAATAIYLERPWMQLNLLDWYILNGYVFDELARFAEGVKSGQASGSINWAYVLSDGNIERTVYWRAGFEVAKLLLRWVLPPAVVAIAYYAGYQETAAWIAIVYGIYLLGYLAFFPRRYLRRKALKKKAGELEGKLHALINVFQSSSAPVLSPLRLRDLIAKTEAEEVFFQPAVYAILDRAVERDPAVFAIEGRK